MTVFVAALLSGVLTVGTLVPGVLQSQTSPQQPPTQPPQNPPVTAPAQPQIPAGTPIRNEPGIDFETLRTRLYSLMQMIQTSRLDEAEQALEVLRTEAGKEPLIDGVNALLLYRRHDYSGARVMIEEALKMPSPPVWWKVLDAMCMYAMGDAKPANELLTKSQTDDARGTAEALVSMGTAALNDCNLTPTVDGYLTLAWLYRTMGSHKNELMALDQALKRFPKEARLAVARLRLLSEAATDPKAVLEQTDKQVAAIPDDDGVLATAGAIYGRLQVFDKAIPTLQKALQLNSKNYSARLDLANVLQQAGKLPEALKEYVTLSTVNPPLPVESQVMVYTGMGSVLTDAKRWREADAALQKGVAIAPDNAALLNNLAWLYVIADDQEVHNTKKALDIANKAVTISHGRNPAILDTLAEAYFAAGDPAKAIETCRRALSLAPANDQFRKHMAKYEAAPRPENPRPEAKNEK